MELVILIIIFFVLNLIGWIGGSKPVTKYYNDTHGTNYKED